MKDHFRMSKPSAVRTIQPISNSEYTTFPPLPAPHTHNAYTVRTILCYQRPHKQDYEHHILGIFRTPSEASAAFDKEITHAQEHRVINEWGDGLTDNFWEEDGIMKFEGRQCVFSVRMV